MNPAAFALQGDTVFFAGNCDPEENCHRATYLERFDARTGAVRRWNALAGKADPSNPDLYNAVAVSGRRLYVGGRFATIGGRRRANVAAIDTRTGRVTRWRADTNNDVYVLVVHGHTLYLGGLFSRVNGHRRDGVAAIDLRSGRLTAWNPNLGQGCSLDAIVVAGKRVYLGGFFWAKGDRRRYLVAANRTNGRLQRWNPRVDGPVHALAVIYNTVYAGGEFTSVFGTRRKNIAAIDAASGKPTAWNPGADAEVRTLLATPASLVASGYFTRLGDVSAEGFGAFPRVGGP